MIAAGIVSLEGQNVPSEDSSTIRRVSLRLVDPVSVFVCFFIIFFYLPKLLRFLSAHRIAVSFFLFGLVFELFPRLI